MNLTRSSLLIAVQRGSACFGEASDANPAGPGELTGRADEDQRKSRVQGESSAQCGYSFNRLITLDYDQVL